MSNTMSETLEVGQQLCILFENEEQMYVSTTAPLTLGELLQRVADSQRKNIIGYRLGYVKINGPVMEVARE